MRDEFTAIFEQVAAVAHSQGVGDVEAMFSGENAALTRFANNAIHQNVAERTLQLSVRPVIGSRTARASTNRLDAEGIRRVVEEAVDLARLTEPVFALFDHAFSWRDAILLSGGLFLVWKATREIHHHVSRDDDEAGTPAGAGGLTMWAAVGQILMLDLVFSIDSIVTAIGMTHHVPIMFVAVIAAVSVMLFAAQPLARFIDRNPSVVMLALSFLIVIGMTLVAEGFGSHVPKGYIYAAMAFSAFVEGMNMLARRAKKRRARAVAGGA